MKKMVVFACLIFAISTHYGEKKSLYNMFADNNARELNDLVTILVSEEASATNKSSNNSNVQQQSAMSAGPGTGGWSNAISLFGSSAEWNNNYKGDGQTSRSNSIETTITAKIVNVLNNGNFELQGSKKLIINGEEEVIFISGEVRPDDISANNLVYSYKLANVELSYKGNGTMDSATKPGILTRVFNWIF